MESTRHPRPRRHRCRRAARLAAAAWLATALPATAATWLCSLSDEGTRLVCLADAEATESASPARPPAPRATVNGTTFPLDPARVYTVPLWAPPTEPDFVALLARATICYRSPDCAVVLAPSPWLGTIATSPQRR